MKQKKTRVTVLLTHIYMSRYSHVPRNHGAIYESETEWDISLTWKGPEPG